MLEEVEPLLHGRKAPQLVRQQELPKHRAIALDIGKGMYTHKEIAAMHNVTATTVNDISKQPALQQFIAKELRRNSGVDEEVVELIKSNVVSAVRTLEGVMKDETQQAKDRIAAAKAIIERRYGLPNQPINRGTDVDLNSLPDSELVKLLANQ